MQKVGIIGNGFVGNALYQNLRDKTICRIYDIDPHRSLNSLQETLSQDLIFICLPTPMSKNGSCNISILEKFFNGLSKFKQIIDSKVFIIKSTVPIGTTTNCCLKYGLKVIHNPEFLTARNAVVDFANSDRTVIGGKLETVQILEKFYQKTFPNTPIIIVKSEESEAIKYISNVFLAYKVAFFNKVYDLCEETNMDYQNVLNGVTADHRIGTSHTQVPGIDNDRGFGGTCFPKDLNSLIYQLDSLGIDSSMFKEIWKYNKSIRKVIDWIII